jgi:hypothetical protein
MHVADSSFLRFVYPFKFATETCDDRVTALHNAVWAGTEQGPSVWQEERFPEDELLPHVAGYLNARSPRKATAVLLRMDSNVLRSTAGLGINTAWDLRLPGTHEDVPFLIEGFQLSLFRFGIGYLTVQVRPDTPAVAAWLDFIHFFRFFRGSRGRQIQGKRRTGPGQVEPFFPEIAADCPGDQEESAGQPGCGLFGQIVDAVLRSGSLPGDESPWWHPVYLPDQLIPYVAVYVDEHEPDTMAELIHRVRNFFHSQQELSLSEYDRRADHPGSLPYADRQWFLVSRDGCAFLALDAPRTPFFRQAMPDHLGKHYFLIFQLVLHQQFVLTRLSEFVAEQWLPSPGMGRRDSERQRRLAFERNLDTLLSFNSRSMFSQICHREHHHRFYVKLQEFYAVDRLYVEIRDEIREMHACLMMQRTEVVQKRLRVLELLAVFIGAPSLVLAFLGINIRGVTAEGHGLTWWNALSLGIGVGTIACLIALLFLFRWANKFDTLFSGDE